VIIQVRHPKLGLTFILEEDIEKFSEALERIPPIEMTIAGRRCWFYRGIRYQAATNPDRPNYSASWDGAEVIFDLNKFHNSQIAGDGE
jgi:hypothetical protein